MTRYRCRFRRSVKRMALAVVCTALPILVSAQQTAPSEQTAEPLADSATIAYPPPGNMSVLPERNFGYVIGDVLTQRISLADSMTPTDLDLLGEVSRVSTWLERQAARLENLDDGRQTLTLRYQIINAPPSIISVALPELNLTDTSGEFYTVAAWPFTLGPLTAKVSLDDAAEPDRGMPVVDGIPLQADMTLPPLDVITPAARLRLALLLLALTLASWAGWFAWRNYRDKARLPFAQAVQTLGSRKQARHGDSNAPWKTMHHAFNQSAGTVLNTSNIDTLLNSHDWLRPLELRIRSFFAASAARHFALPARDEPFAIEELAKALADCERRNSR